MNPSRLAALVAVVAAALFPSAAANPAPADFVGDWAGSIVIAGQEFDVVLHFKMEKDALTGTVDVPKQGAEGLPLTGIAVDDRTLTCVIDGVPGDPTFKGTLDSAGTTISGTFSQSGYDGTFSVTKKVEKK